VVIAVLADIVEVVVFSACTNAFLGVRGAFQSGKVGIGVYSSEEDRFVLVHASIGEEEGGVVEGDDRGGGDYIEWILVYAGQIEYRHVRYQKCDASL
jgi:hypothetical protein